MTLDEEKREIVLRLLANGNSRRVAARFVGCAPSTITRTAQRDEDFRLRMARAEQLAEVDAMRSIRNAARNERYWRAAAWILERKNPEDFAPRPPHTITLDQAANLMGQMADVVAQEVPAETIVKILTALAAAVEELEREAKAERPPLTSEELARLLDDSAPPPTPPLQFDENENIILENGMRMTRDGNILEPLAEETDAAEAPSVRGAGEPVQQTTHKDGANEAPPQSAT